MDRQAKKLTGNSKEGENGSENGSELISNSDSESEEKVRFYFSLIVINIYNLFCMKNYYFYHYFNFKLVCI